MKCKKILFFLFLLLLFFVMFRIWYMNSMYPEPNVKTYSEGETLKTQGFELTLESWKFYNQTDLEQILTNNQIDDIAPKAQKKMFCTQLSVKNVENEINIIDITDFSFESLAWHNQWDMELFYILNGTPDMFFELEPGETCDITLPIILYDFQFKSHSWKNIGQRPFSLVISYYPIKYVFTNR